MTKEEIENRIEVCRKCEMSYREVGNTKRADKFNEEIHKWEKLLSDLELLDEKKVKELLDYRKGYFDLKEQNQKYKEIINKLKDISKNRHTNGKVLWFDKDYAKTYGELCTMAGASDTRLAVVCLYELENILKEVE